MLDALRQDLRYSFRNLRSRPGFAAVAILSLALGIGANTAIFSLIDAVMLKYLPVSHPEQLLQVTFQKSEGSSFTNPLWEALRDRQQVFSGVFASGLTRFNLNQAGEARYAPAVWASGAYFSTLGVSTAIGRTFTPAEDRRGCAATAVLGYDFWQKEYAGQLDVLGRVSLRRHPFEIIGVAQAGFFGLQVGSTADIFVPLCAEPVIGGENSNLNKRGNWWLVVIGRPKPGLQPQRVTAVLKTIAPQALSATIPPDWGAEDKLEYERRSFETLPVRTECPTSVRNTGIRCWS
jgi:hypothetical protein